MKLRELADFNLLETDIHKTSFITPPPILDTLLASNIPFTVVGAIAVNCYIDRPRNSQDIDVLTHKPEELVDYVSKIYPNLERKASEAVIRFSRAGKEVLDIMVPYHEIFKQAMRDTRKRGHITVPSPEALIVMKFAAILAKSRRATDKLQDRTDIARILDNQKISIEKINRHLVCLYPEAVSDFKIFIKKLHQI
jgi:predicted nucleotidyltransferase